MDWDNFTPIAAALGGALIGAASLMLLLFNGRTAGVSGIAGGVLRFNLRDLDWRLAVLGGLLIAPVGWGGCCVAACPWSKSPAASGC